MTKVAPKLRFPEFTDEWQHTNLTTVSGTGQYGMNVSAKTYDGQNKYLRITDIDDESHKFYVTNITSPSGSLDDKYIMQPGDFTVARTGASTGKSYLYSQDDDRVYFAGFLIRFRVKPDYDPRFVYVQTLRKNYDKWVQVTSARSGQPGINADEYGKYEFLIPSRDEQQKIANFLTTVDEKIASIDKKVELLKQYKKGVMQKIFTQKLRFNFKDTPEVTTLEMVVRSISTGLNPRKNFTLNQGKNYYVTIKNIRNGTIDFSSADMISDESIAMIARRSKLQKGDIIMSSIGNIGESYLLKEDPSGWNINESVFAIKPNENKIISQYLYQLLISDNTHRYFDSNSTGSSFKSIKMTELKALQIALPRIEEQQKIANFLSAIDEKIKAEETKLTSAKKFKKALLQRMFV